MLLDKDAILPQCGKLAEKQGAVRANAS